MRQLSKRYQKIPEIQRARVHDRHRDSNARKKLDQAEPKKIGPLPPEPATMNIHFGASHQVKQTQEKN
jgi:hypothetical protein